MEGFDGGGEFARAVVLQGFVVPGEVSSEILGEGFARIAEDGFGLLDQVASGNVVERPLFRVLAGAQ